MISSFFFLQVNVKLNVFFFKTWLQIFLHVGVYPLNVNLYTYIHTFLINPRSHVTIQDAMKLSYGAFFNVFFKMARLISALSKKVTPYKKGLVDSPNGF